MAAGGSTAAALGGWICFEDEAGRSLRPPKARTWGRRGRTPVVRVPAGRGRGKVTIAGLACYRPGHRAKFLHKLHVYRGRKGETKSFTWRDYRNLLWAAHIQLDAPIILVWDNPVFLRINVVLTATWAAAFTASALALYAAHATGHGDTAITLPIQAAGFLIPAYVTARYPERARARATQARVQQG